MIVSLIAAVAENHVIGRYNDLIWHLPADIKFFKETTMNHCVLMGRKNFESIPEKFRPLPNRTNIVVTRDPSYQYKDAIVVNSIEEGIEQARESGEKELFIIGGGEVYKQSIEIADKLYITTVHHSFMGDTYFPQIDEGKWEETSRRFRPSDEKNPYDMTFLTYSKK